MEWASVTVMKLIENDTVVLWEDLAYDWNPHVDLDDPDAGPNAIGQEFGAGSFRLLDNDPARTHPDPHEVEFRYIERIVEEDINTTVTYSYHVL
ncbi:MAG TPA: hypothetical protein VF190_05765 [Rhodothermales bacterium]